MRVFVIFLYLLISIAAFSQTKAYIEELKATPNDSISRLITLKNRLEASVASEYQDSSAFEVYNSIGLTFYGKNQPKFARTFFERALEVAKSSGDTEKSAQMLSNIGVMHEITGDYVGALHYYQQSLDVFIKSENIKGQSLVYNNIAIVHQELGNHTQAGHNLKYSYELKKQLNDTLLMASALNNLGVFYEESVLNYDSAIYYYNEAMRLYQMAGDRRNEAICLNNTGLVLLKSLNYNEALSTFEQTIAMFTALDDKLWLSKALMYAGQAEMASLNLNQAVSLLEEAYNIVKESEFARHAMDVSGMLAQAYMKAGMFEKSAKLFEKHLSIKDSLTDIDKQKEVKKLEMMFHTAQKELEIENLKHKSHMQQQREKQILLWVAVITLFLVFVIVFLYMKGRQRQLLHQNRNMLIKQQILQQQMNPHFLFNVLTSIQSFLHKAETEKAGGYLSKFSRLTRMVLQSSAQETISLSEEIALLSDYISLEQLRAEPPFTTKISTNGLEDADDIQIPPMMVQPFVENAIKHGLLGKPDGLLELEVKEVNENGFAFIIFTITDNGPALNKGKDNQSGHKSLAMKIINERITILNKKTPQKILLRYPHIAQGTKAELRLPIL